MERSISSSLLQIIFILCVFFPILSISTALVNETDRLSLLAFKDRLHDPLQVMSSWNESMHVCEWEGLTCGRRHQRVVTLNLSSQGLLGSLSPYIGNLSFLRVLSLENNTLQGNVPQEIGYLSKLETLRLHNNSFEGQIPTNLVQCSNLIHLNLASNKLVGGIPSELGSFPKLVRLVIQSNHLTGRIPVSIGNLSSLQVLSAGYNNLIGGVPHSLSQLESLTFLSLGGNMLSGILPPSIYNLSSLQVIDLDENNLEGSLPLTIGHDFPDLRYFYIASNRFSGSLPVSLFTNASQLAEIDVGNNKFVGQVPKEVGNLKEIAYLRIALNYLGSGGKNGDLAFITSLSNCSNLVKLSIPYNNFGGRLPASLTNLSVTLNSLKLGYNQIFGSIPSDIWKLKNLVLLEASNNSLTGTIPKDIGMLQNLQAFGIDNNRLSGKIPDTIGNLTSLFWLTLSNNMLEGNIEANLGKCQYLQKLVIDRNRFTGTIPKQILGLSINLLAFDMSDNYLVGLIPQEVGELKSLIYLDLSGNKLSGEIPVTLGSCISMKEIYLAGNSFQGSIPLSFASLVSIELIDLSRNNLSGNIPEDLENLRSLQYFNISFNNIEGKVPAKGIFRNTTAIAIVGNDKLCGGSSKLELPKCRIQKSKKKVFPMALKVIICILVSLSIIATLLVLLALQLRKKPNAKSVSNKNANELKCVSYNEIREATNGFSSENLIGSGSCALIYKGLLQVDGSVIAVKVFNLMERSASKSFETECEVLRKIRHRNLLKIITACSSADYDGNDFKALILEFMPNGSLEEWLHPIPNKSQRSSRVLNLLQRLNIAIDVASALDYLHNRNHDPIVHCDLKPSNVLLDQDLVSHVGDFGLAKILSASHSSLNRRETTSTAVRGTLGYIPPEYGMGSPLSTQGDMYSYGIMLLEMFTGRRPTDEMFNDTLSLHNFCKVNLVEKEMDILNINPLMEQFQDDNIDDKEEERSMTESTNNSKMIPLMLSVIEIGVGCSSDEVLDRMEIKDVLKKMQKIKQGFVSMRNSGKNTTTKMHT